MYVNRESVARVVIYGKESILSYLKKHYQSPSLRVHWKHYLRDGLIILAIAGGIAMMFRAGAATYTFTQSSWAGGATANKANHTSNRTGWTQFESSSGVVGGSSLTLSFTSASSVDATIGLTALGTPTIATQTGPQKIAVSADGLSVYVANFSSNTVSMYSRNTSTGALTALSPATIATGSSPQGITISPDGASVYVANFFGHTVSMYSRNTSTGALTALGTPTISSGSNPWAIAVSADGLSVYATNFSSSTVSMYSRNTSTGALTALGTPTIATGSGPQGITLSSDGASAYVVNGNANTLSMYSRNTSTGALTALSPATIATGSGPQGGVVVSPDGTSVYVTNYNAGTLSLYSRNTSTGALTALSPATIATGANPQQVTISPDGAAVYVTNYTSNSVSMYSRNTSTGALTALGTPTISSGARPQGIAISSDGLSVYVANENANTISMFRRSVSGGAPGFEAGSHSSTSFSSTGGSVILGGIGALSGSVIGTYTVGANPYGIAYDPTQNAVWVANNGGSNMTKLNASTGAVVGSYGSLAQPKFVAYDSTQNAIWYTSGGNTFINKLNASTGASIGSYNLGRAYGIAYDSTQNAIWVTTATPQLLKVNATNGSISTSSSAYSFGGGDSIVYDSAQNAAWFTRGTVVYKKNASTFIIISTTTLPSLAKDMVYDSTQNAIWVTHAGPGLVKINASTGATIGTYTLGTSAVEGVAYDSIHNAIWVVNTSSSTVTKVNAVDGSVIDTYSVGSSPKRVAYDSTQDAVWVSNNGTTTVTKLGSGFQYYSSGIFTSAVIDFSSVVSPSTLEYASTLNGQTIVMDIRAGNTASPDGTWTSWQTSVANGGSISGLSGYRYFQYRATLSTNNEVISPSLDSVTINYDVYSSSGTLTSSPFDSGSTANILSKIEWSATQPGGAQVKFQVRTAPDSGGSPGTWTSWMGPDGTSGSFFTVSDGSEVMPNALKDGADDQWFQYKATLTQSSGATPTLTAATVTYVVNAPPEFDASFGTNGVTATQIATSSDANIGKVLVQYKVRDADSTTGSVTPGYVTPAFEYDIGGGWLSIPAENLSTGAVANKAVNESTYTLYEAYVDVATLLPATYTTNARIRVNVNDNEGANNIVYATSSAFTLDTKAPVVSSMHINGTSATSTVTVATTDDTTIRGYILSNSADFSADGTNVTSGIEQSVESPSASIAVPWTLSAGATKTVYVKVFDTQGNFSTESVVVPANPSNIEYRDISNIDMDSYREFIAWNLYPDPVPAGAPFGSYELYRSSDGSDYSLLYTSTNPAINYYIDTPVSTSTIYYYKVLFITDNGDRTAFSPVVSDAPDGKGGTNNGALPLISAVTAAEVKNTSAKITWTTDDLALSEVDFGASNSYGSVATNRSYVTSHAVYLTSLTPNTTYYYRVRSIDAFSVSATDSNAGNGYTFTTGGGPVISNVTVPSVNDNSAEISWKTNIPADSYVTYSTSPTLSSSTQAGSSDLVQSPFQHTVTLSGLSTDTMYYFKVASTDDDDNTTEDDNNGSFFSLRTTNDTRAPVISDVTVPVKASDSAVITWRTDELSSSKVEYGTLSGASSSYAFSTTEITTPTIFHSIALSSQTNKSEGGNNALTRLTKYYYRVKSTDPAGNSTYSSEGDFTTTEDGAIVVASGGSSASSGKDDKDTTRPTVSDIKVTDLGPFSATATFTTDEDTRAIVQYGTTAEYGNSAGAAALSKQHKVILRGLKMGTKYHFSVNAVDKSGNMSTSADQEFQTTNLAEDLGSLAKLEQGMDSLQEQIENLIESALPSINPPFIEKPTVEEIGEDFVRISWKTNVKSYGSIIYAEDQEFSRTGLYVTEQSKTDSKTTDHVMDLSNLKPNTKYHFKVKSYVFVGADAQSSDMTFVTKAGRVQPQVRDRKKDSMRVVWDTPVPTNSIVSYKVRGSQYASRKQDEGLTTSHDIMLDNLTPKTTYEIRVSGTTQDGNTIEARETIIASTNEDNTPPTISNFKVDSALVPGRNDRTQTIVSWKTDEPATSVVYYEEGPGSATAELSQTKDNGLTYTDNHVVILTNLKPGTIYRFQIVSVDDANNMMKLPIRTIVTPSQSESIVDVIFKNFDDTFKFMRQVR